MLLRNLTAAAALVLMPAASTYADPPSQVVYAPPGYGFGFSSSPGPFAVTGSKTRQFSWGPGLIGRHLGDALNRRHVWTLTHTRVQFYPAVGACYTASPCPSAQSAPAAPTEQKPHHGGKSITLGEEAPAAPPVPTPVSSAVELTPIAEAGTGSDTVRFLPTGRNIE